MFFEVITGVEFSNTTPVELTPSVSAVVPMGEVSAEVLCLRMF